MSFKLSKKSVLHALPLLVAVMLPACDDDDVVNPPLDVEWEAALVGAGTHANVTGTAAVESSTARFIADVSIAHAAAGAEFDWTLARGTCASPGTALGAANRYPALDVASNGTASAEADVPVGLDEDEDYIVRVFDASGTTPVAVACGPLEVQ